MKPAARANSEFRVWMRRSVPMWWARITNDTPDYRGRFTYGRWVPTGCEEQQDAREYVWQLYGPVYVIEWLQW